MDYWIDHPPVDELVAAYLGVKARPKRRGGYATEEQIKAMAQAMGG
ncbi:MAG: hypothetical protein RJA59_1168 [Pseudomonadota bacterium]